MDIRVKVSTQGINNEFTAADGRYDNIDRGMMGEDDLIQVLIRLKNMLEPDYSQGDICPPHVIVEGPAGQFGFSVTEGRVFNVDTGGTMTPYEAAMAAMGQVPETAPGPVAPPAPGPAPQPTYAPPAYQQPVQSAPRRPKSRIGLKLLFVFLFVIVWIGAIAAYAYGSSGTPSTTVFGVITVVLVVIYLFIVRLVFRSGSTYDDGSGLMMAHMMNHDDYADDYGSDYSDGGGWD